MRAFEKKLAHITSRQSKLSIRVKGWNQSVAKEFIIHTIPHDRLMGRLRERIADGRVLKLIVSFLKAGIIEGD